MTSALSLCAALVISCGSKSKGLVVMGSESEMDTLSYAMGLDMTNGLRMDRNMSVIGFDYDCLKNGMKNAALGGDLLIVEGDTISDATYGTVLQDFFRAQYPKRMRTLENIEAAKNDTTGTVPAVDPASIDFDVNTLFATEAERKVVSTAFGYDIGSNLVNRNLPLQLVWIFNGIDDVNNATEKMSQREAGDYLEHYFMVRIPAENLKASQEWLAEIEKESGVHKTASGLLYKIVEEGDMSAKATSETDVVKVHYKGTTRAGKVFDASRFADKPEATQQMLKQMRPDSYDADEPIEFPLNRVIKGWTEGMQLVGKGGKITLWIPSELAYGTRGAGQDIAPNEALRFDVELIDVNPAAKTETAE